MAKKADGGAAAGGRGKAKGKAKGKGGRKRSFVTTFVSLPLCLAIAVIALPTTIVVMVGLVPTFAARFTDTTRGFYTTRCVGALNFAGIAPFLRILWTGAHDIAQAKQIVSSPFTWLVAYGAAGLGWLLFLSLPNAVVMFKTMEYDLLLRRLRQRQQELVEEWGPTIVARAKTVLARAGR